MPEEDTTTPALTVTLERQGRKFRALEEYELQGAYTQSTDRFGFVASENEETRADLFDLELEPVELSIDGASQMLGRIEKTGPAQGANARRYQGRDYIADLVECHIDPGFKLDDGHTVEVAIRLAAEQCGITHVLAESDVWMRNVRTGKAISGGATTAPDYRAEKLSSLKATPGEGIYSLINRIAARHHSTIQPGTARDHLVLAQPNFSQAPTQRLVRKLSGSGNNIKRADAHRDYSSFPTWIMGTGRFGSATKTRTAASHQIGLFARAGFRVTDGKVALPPKHLGLIFGSETNEIIPSTESSSASGGDGRARQSFDPTHGIVDEVTRVTDGKTYVGRIGYGYALEDPTLLYRLHTFKDEQARNDAQLESSTMRRLADMLKPTLVYTATVAGHRDPITDTLWAIDTMVEVFDEKENVNEVLWVAARTFKFSESSGRTTELELWRPSAYRL